MIPYLIPVILIIIGIYRYDVQQRSVNSRYLYWFIGLYLILLFGLRDHIGWDTRMYTGFWDWFPSFRDNYDGALVHFQFMQPGFQYLWLICKEITPEFWFFQIVQCTFVVIVPMWFIRKRTRYHFVGLLLFALCYCWYFCTEILRESISICFFLLVFDALMKRKWIQYFIGCFCAFMFHFSAGILFLFPLATVLNLRLNRTFIITTVCIFLALSIAHNYVYQISTSLGGTYADKLVIYATTTALGRKNMNWMILRVIQMFILPFTILVIYKFILKRKIPYESIFCIYILCGAGIPVFEEVFVRFTNYPMPVYLVSLATLFGESIKHTSNRKTVGYILLGMVLVTYLYNPIKLELSDPTLIPYKWIVNFD